MNIKEIILWITGKNYINNKKLNDIEKNIVNSFIYLWTLNISDNFVIYAPSAPNFIWRFLQYCILGFKWRRINEITKY